MQSKIKFRPPRHPVRASTDQNQVDDISVSGEQHPIQQQIEPTPETISNSIPHGLNPYHPQQQPSSIASIFRSIQNPINYEHMTEQDIGEEKLTLENHVRFLNQQLDQLVSKKMLQIEQGLSRKIQRSRNNCRFKYNQWDNAGTEMQVMNNRKLLILLREQHESLSAKLEKIEQYDHRVKYDGLIREAKDNISKMRMGLSDRKRKNVLNGRKITQLDNRDVHKQYYDCQQQYVALAKKKQEYSRRVDKIVQDNVVVVEQQASLEGIELMLKKQLHSILTSLPNQMELEHSHIMYETKCRKMGLCLRKREREEQQWKRKYYGLLKEYEKVVESTKGLDDKLMAITSELQALQSNLKNKQIKLHQTNEDSQIRIWKTEKSRQSEQNQAKSEEKSDEQGQREEGFMLTEINNQKSTTRISKNKPVTPQHIKLPNFQKMRSQSEYHQNKAPIKITKMRTDYSREEKGNDLLEETLKDKKQFIHETKEKQKNVEQSYNCSGLKGSSGSFSEVMDYPDDFQEQNPAMQ